MNKIRMLVVNDFDESTVTLDTGTEVPSLPCENLKIYNNSRIFRVTSTEFVLTGNFNNIRLINALVLWRHNWTAAAKFRLELFGSVDQTGGTLFDSGWIDALPQVTYGEWDWRLQPVVSSLLDGWATKYSQLWFGDVFASSYRLTVQDPLNESGQLDLTRIYMGRHYSPEVNFSWGSTFAFGSNETQQRTDDGGLFSNATAAWRKVSFSLAYINEEDRPGLIAAIRHAKLSRDWFISLYPEEGTHKEIEHSFACKFTALPPVTSTSFNNFSTAVSVEEC
jgi:hypothetical protein